MTIEQSETTAPSYTRLHITPLDADLLSVVLSTSLLPKARNISYHSLETFPEKRYGFVELPAEDAEKLRKKLHGAVLKGVKLRVEKARPSTMPEPMGAEALADEKPSKKEKKAKKDKSKKRKRDGEELVGVELEEGRKVKRGWTVTDEPAPKKDKRDKSKDKDEKKKGKRKLKSKYTEHEECLARTILPPNKVAALDESGSRKKKKDRSREVVIHEFEKTAKFPTFLKDTSASYKANQPAEYVDGKGWVDAEGNVVEPARARPVPPSTAKPPKQVAQKSSSGKDEDSSSSEVSSEAEDASEDGATASAPPRDDDSNSNSETDEPALLPAEKQPRPQTLRNLPSSPLAFKSDGRPKSSGSTRSLSIKIPPVVSPATPAPAKVHPLEALYKRPKNEDGTQGKADSDFKGFSFFEHGDAEEEESEGEVDALAPSSQGQPPMTPFTRQEFEFRTTRSAAPTPDTAHPNRTFKPWAHDDAEDDLEEEEEDEDEGKGDEEPEDEEMGDAEGPPAAAGDQVTGDFPSWFWEHRGDLNRSWKKRRKLMAKEKRYRENKARAERSI